MVEAKKDRSQFLRIGPFKTIEKTALWCAVYVVAERAVQIHPPAEMMPSLATSQGCEVKESDLLAVKHNMRDIALAMWAEVSRIDEEVAAEHET